MKNLNEMHLTLSYVRANAFRHVGTITVSQAPRIAPAPADARREKKNSFFILASLKAIFFHKLKAEILYHMRVKFFLQPHVQRV